MESLVKNDQYLESIFWERVILYADPDSSPGQWLSWLDQAIRKGYPAAHLLVAKGLLLNAAGKKLDAVEAFNQALHSPLNMTNASEYLQAVDRLKLKPRP